MIDHTQSPPDEAVPDTAAPIDLPFTGERFIPGSGGPEIHLEHLHRYCTAASLVDGMVLDLGCGAGYGSQLLSRRATSVVGIDVVSEALRYARARFPAANVHHVNADCRGLPFAADSFDAVVCFELIEHVQDAEVVLAEAQRVLSARGSLVISTPNRPVYSDGRGHRNPYHHREYDAEEFRSLLASHFSHVKLYGQRVVAGSWTWSIPLPDDERRLKWIRVDPALAPGICEDHEPMYFVAICSARPIGKPRLPPPDSLVTGSLESLVGGRDREVDRLTEQTAKLDRLLAERVRRIGDLVEHAAELEEVVAERDRHIRNLTDHASNLEVVIAERDQHILGLTEHGTNLEGIVAEREQHISNLTEHATNMEHVVAERDRYIVGLREHVANLEAIVIERDRYIEGLTEHVANLEAIIAQGKEQVGGLGEQVTKLKNQIGGLSEHVTKLKGQAVERDEQVRDLTSHVHRSRATHQYIGEHGCRSLAI